MDANTQNNPPSESPAPAPEPYAVATLKAWRPDVLIETKWAFNELTLTVAREQIVAVCEALREAGYNFLSDVTCVDWFPSEPRFHVIYHLLSHGRKERVRLKVLVESLDPVVETITSVWPTANYYEREIFDLFGVRFGGHPNMRRILMPEDWEGHPLRKDYPVEGYR
jgi:NADH-quinone oxidoreductase subunit C